MKVVIIGSGNVANVLGKRIMQAGNEILQVAGRNKDEVVKLAKLLHARAVYSISQVTTLADIYILAVPDKAVKQMADELRLQDKIVVHCAAALPDDILQCSSSKYGVIYPLQTIKKGISSDVDIPAFVSGNNENTTATLADFANSWSANVHIATSQQRLKLHVAAVFVNNFINHLFTLIKKYCDENDLDYNMLQPIINETMHRIQQYDPATLQTGPAIRHDMETILKHTNILSGNQSMLGLYNAFTNSIMTFYKNDISTL